MKLRYRPLALGGFTVLAVLFMSIFVDDRLSLISVAGGTLLFICCVIFRKIRDKVFPFFIASAMILGGMLFTVQNDYGLEYARTFIKDGESLITGYITDYPDASDSRYYYLIETTAIDSKPIKTELRLSLPNEISAEPYDKIQTKAKLYMIGKSSGTDIERYFNSKEIFLGAYSYNNEDETDILIQHTDNKPLKYSFIRLRREIEERILDKLPNEYGGTAVALLLGDKSCISRETKDKLYEAGVAPVFAVSGLHLSIWVMGLYEILNQLKLKKRVNSLINIAFTLFFMALTGFSPSVCRSGLMMILLLSGNLFYRRSDSINSLGFAALILCCVNPFIAADIGFLMSFSATLGIILIYPLIEKHLISKIRLNVLKIILSAIVVSITAILGSLPVTVIFIEYIAVWSVLTNLFVTYAAAICMILSGFTAILSRINFVSDITAFWAGLLAKYILKVVDIVNSFSVTSISTADIFWKGGVILCLVAVIFATEFFKGKTAFRVTSVLLCAIILGTSLGSVFYYDGMTRVEILDVGDGICITAANGKRKILLCGENNHYNSVYMAEDSLDRINRLSTNLLLIPNVESAECPNTLQLLKYNDFFKVVMPYCPQSASTLIDSGSLITASDSTLNVWQNASIEYHSDNETSYAYCAFDSKTFFIIFSSKRNTEFEEKYLSADYLICSGYIPNSLDPSAYGTVIISTVKKVAKHISEYVSDCGGRAISTCDVGNISVKIRNSESKIYLKEG